MTVSALIYGRESRIMKERDKSKLQKKKKEKKINMFENKQQKDTTDNILVQATR